MCVGANAEKVHPMSGLKGVTNLTVGMNAPDNYQITYEGKGVEWILLSATNGQETSKSKPQFASNARPGQDLRPKH